MSRKIIELDAFRTGFSDRSNRAHAPGETVVRAGQGLSVLIISRDADNAASVCQALSEMDHYDADVATVKSVAEARTTMSHDHFELLILDDRLLSGSAMSLIRELAGRKPSCASILIVSGRQGKSKTQKIRRTGHSATNPQATAGFLKILPSQGLEGQGLQQAIGEVLETARSKDRKAASRELAKLRKSEMHKSAVHKSAIHKSGGRKPGTRSIDQVLPWVRGLLGELNKIHGGASLALEGLGDLDNEDPKALLHSAVQVSDHLRAEILDTIRQLEASQRPAEARPETVDITQLLEQVVRDYRIAAEARGQTLNYRRPDLPLTLAANTGSVRDVFCVILRNTIRNTSENTRIDIALSIRSGEICISVCDTCPSGHWTKALCPDQANSSETGSVMREKAGSIILINELMRECNGSIDITTQNHSNEMRCFFPRRGVA